MVVQDGTTTHAGHGGPEWSSRACADSLSWVGPTSSSSQTNCSRPTSNNFIHRYWPSTFPQNSLCCTNWFHTRQEDSRFSHRKHTSCIQKAEIQDKPSHRTLGPSTAISHSVFLFLRAPMHANFTWGILSQTWTKGCAQHYRHLVVISQSFRQGHAARGSMLTSRIEATPLFTQLATSSTLPSN